MVEPVLRPARRQDNRGRPWHDTRAVLHGVLWILGSGAQWSEMPAKYPPYQTCHRRFQRKRPTDTVLSGGFLQRSQVSIYFLMDT